MFLQPSSHTYTHFKKFFFPLCFSKLKKTEMFYMALIFLSFNVKIKEFNALFQKLSCMFYFII